MSVENNVHHRPHITVADGSEAKTGPVRNKPGPARPTPGHANAPARPLPDIKPDPKPSPKRALSRNIDVGLDDIHSGKLDAGKARVKTGIGNVVKYLTGKGIRATYAEAKPATNEILAAYSRRPPRDVKEVVDGVNNYLQAIVIEDLLTAKYMANSSLLVKALATAGKYFTDAGPNSRTPADRLESMIEAINEKADKDAARFLTNLVKIEFDEATGSRP